jgi:hypothetical protein
MMAVSTIPKKATRRRFITKGSPEQVCVRARSSSADQPVRAEMRGCWNKTPRLQASFTFVANFMLENCFDAVAEHWICISIEVPPRRVFNTPRSR